MKKGSFSRHLLVFLLLLLFCGGALGTSFFFFHHGMTLKEAQNYSQNYKLPFFIYHENSKRYTSLCLPLTSPISPGKQSCSDSQTTALLIDSESDQRSFRSGDAVLHLSSGDKLVYISTTDQAPDSFSVYPISQSGYTLPALFQSDSANAVTTLNTPVAYVSGYANPYPKTFREYDSKNGPDLSSLSTEADLVTVGGSSLQEYATSPPLQSAALAPSSGTTQSVVDLTGSTEPVTIGYYSGTAYHSFQLKPDCRWLAVSPNAASVCQTSLTQNGFAQIELSDFMQTPGFYAIQPLSTSAFYLVFEVAD